MTTSPMCSRPDDTGAHSCPNSVVAGTTECLQHAEPSPHLHGNGYTGVYSRGTNAWTTPSAPEPTPLPPARPYRVTRSPMIADPPRTAAQAAAFRAVDDAVRRSLTAHAAEVTRRAVAAGWLPAAPSAAPRPGRLARAIGWFRR